MPVSHKKSTKAKTSPTNTSATNHIHVSRQRASIIVIVALLVLNMLLFSALNKIQTLTNQQNTIIPIQQQQTYNDISVVVSSVQPETGYIMGIKPAEDEKIISVVLAITNDSKEDFEFYPTVQTFIRDNQGSQYIMAPVDLIIPFAGKTIKPGETKVGQLSYLVTNRAVPLFLYVESRQDNAGPFVIKIQ